MKWLLSFLFLTHTSAALFDNTVRAGDKLSKWQEIPNYNKTVIAERWSTCSELILQAYQEGLTSVHLLDDISVDVETTEFEFVSRGIWNWRGKVKQAEFIGRFVLTIIQDDLTGDVNVMGSVQVDQRFFVFSAAEGSLVRIVEIDESEMPPMNAIHMDKPPKAIAQHAQEEDETIRVLALFPYAQPASCQDPTVINQINQLTATIENQLRSTWTSTYNISVEAVGECFVSPYTDLNQQLTFVSYSEDVAEIRNRARGDLVVVTGNQGGLCGVAYVNAIPFAPSAERWAFSASSLSCMGIFVLEHEFGHNMGLRHDRYYCSEDNEHGCFGGFNPPNSNAPIFRSIMSYEAFCYSVGRRCPPSPVYSEDSLYGNPPGNYPGPADARRYFLDAAPIVANFR